MVGRVVLPDNGLVPGLRCHLCHEGEVAGHNEHRDLRPAAPGRQPTVRTRISGHRRDLPVHRSLRRRLYPPRQSRGDGVMAELTQPVAVRSGATAYSGSRGKPATFYLSKVAFWLLVLLILIYTLFPFYWAIATSLKRSSDLFTTPV